MQLWALLLRAIAMFLYRQAFPDFRELDAEWEKKTNRICGDLQGYAARLEDGEGDIR